MVRIILALCLLTLPLAAGAASFAKKYSPGISYYFEYFDPGPRPWKPGNDLNIEEVFKNFQYYEIVFDDGGEGITVHSFVKGSKAGSEKYRILPDGALQKSGQPKPE